VFLGFTNIEPLRCGGVQNTTTVLAFAPNFLPIKNGA
jgi:hypothetical protein